MPPQKIDLSVGFITDTWKEEMSKGVIKEFVEGAPGNKEAGYLCFVAGVQAGLLKADSLAKVIMALLPPELPKNEPPARVD